MGGQDRWLAVGKSKLAWSLPNLLNELPNDCIRRQIQERVMFHFTKLWVRAIYAVRRPHQDRFGVGSDYILMVCQQ